MHLPIAFEPNQGQFADGDRFLARGAGFTLALSDSGARLHLAGDDGEWQITLSSDRANPVAPLKPEHPLPGRVNYLIGSDPATWHRDVPTFARVRYEQVYDGVDLVFYGNQGRLEYDYVVQPGADPGRIRIRIGGAERLSLDDHGNLVMSRAAQTVTQLKPVVYQEIGGVRREVTGRYSLSGPDLVGFVVDDYDSREPLVIDPILTFSTFLGSSVTYARGIALDGDGFVYVTGSTTSSSFPIVGGLPGGYRGGTSDGFVTKLTPEGDAVVYSTFIGGSYGGAAGFGGQDYGHDLVVDSLGQVHLIGSTFSRDFPVVNPFQPSTPTKAGVDGQADVFVTTLTAAGSDIVFSTYLGGLLQDQPGDIAVDAAGNTYAVGDTISTDFPVLNALQPTKKSGVDETEFSKRPDLFITKLSPTGAGLFSTYFGGLQHDAAPVAAVDSAGNIVFAGTSLSNDYPTLNPLMTCSTTPGGFITKLNAAGTAMLYSTCFAGVVKGLALDGTDAIYVAGNQSVPGTLPATTGAYQTTFGGSAYDMFAAKLTPSGAQLAYATYIGRTNEEHVFSVAVDAAGAAYIAGDAFGPDFPIVNAVQPTAGGVGWPSVEAVVVKVAPDGGSLQYSTFLGGDSPYGEQAWDIAVDAAGNAFVVGWTDGGTFPITPGAIQTTQSGRTGFISRISPGGNPSCTPAFHRAAATVGPNGGPAKVGVLAFASDCAWSVSSSAPSWLIPTSGTSGQGIGSVAYTVGFNSGPSRVATLTLNGGATFTVEQQGATGTCSFAFSPGSISLGADGGTGTTQLTTSSGCAWVAASSASWLSITGSNIGSGTSTIAYSVAPNTATTSRFATITAGGAAFGVQQSGATVVVTPAPGNLQVLAIGNAVQLTWSAPVGASPAGYVLEVGSASGASNLITFATGTTATLFNATAPNGTYYIRVRAVYPSGMSAPSNEATLQVGCLAAPPSPTSLNVQLAGNVITLTWLVSSPPGTSQLLEAGRGPGLADIATIAMPATQASFTASAPGGTYYVRVRAANACGTSRPSGEIFFTVGTGVSLPGAPSGLAANVTGRDIALAWTPPAGAVTGYLIEAGSGAGLADLLSRILPGSPAFAASNIPPGTFHVRVRAINAAGVGPPTPDVIVNIR